MDDAIIYHITLSPLMHSQPIEKGEAVLTHGVWMRTGYNDRAGGMRFLPVQPPAVARGAPTGRAARNSRRETGYYAFAPVSRLLLAARRAAKRVGRAGQKGFSSWHVCQAS